MFDSVPVRLREREKGKGKFFPWSCDCGSLTKLTRVGNCMTKHKFRLQNDELDQVRVNEND